MQTRTHEESDLLILIAETRARLRTLLRRIPDRRTRDFVTFDAILHQLPVPQQQPVDKKLLDKLISEIP